MALRTLDQLRGLKNAISVIHKGWLKLTCAIDIPANVKLSLSARLVAGRRGSISVGEETLIAFKSLIFTFDPVRGEDRPVHIGSRCFIGGGSTIMPGVTIGNQCIVGAGSVVFDDVPDNSIVVGNPAKCLRSGVSLGAYGVLPVAKENTQRLWRLDE